MRMSAGAAMKQIAAFRLPRFDVVTTRRVEGFNLDSAFA
jgi:hypothetical protein